MMWNQEEFPYGGASDPNSGFIRGGSSEDRARSEDSSGITALRQREALAALANAERVGMTWKEVALVKGWHHGQASGALSGLHKAGRIARLALRRNRCAIYVLPEFVDGRTTERQGETETTKMLRQAVGLLDSFVNNPPCRHRLADPDLANCKNCQANYLIDHYQKRSN